jgi:hypothetical protein
MEWLAGPGNMVSVNQLFPSGKGRLEKIVSDLPRSCLLEKKHGVLFSASSRYYP